MHFAGWKLGLKTGMYYLRTMAASAPIQFTVDQEALKIADTNIARELRPSKKRPSTGFIAPAAAKENVGPRPMYVKQLTDTNTNTAPNGMPTPSTTPPPGSEAKKFSPAAVATLAVPGFKADIEEGDSPKTLATEPATAPPKEEQLPEPAIKSGKQDEDKVEESDDREHDIYADAVLQCSIDNKDACIMCSG